MNNIFITGERWSSAARELMMEIKELMECEIGGYWVQVTRCKDNGNIRIFDLTSLYDGNKDNIFFRKDDSTGISKLNIEIFNAQGVDMLRKSFEYRNTIIMNEIGFLESKAYAFIEEVVKLLDSSKIVIALVKEVKCPYIDSIISREDSTLFRVTEENKEFVKQKILEQLRNLNVAIR